MLSAHFQPRFAFPETIIAGLRLDYGVSGRYPLDG